MAQLPQGGLNAVAPQARVPQPPPQQGQPQGQVDPARDQKRIAGLEQEVPAEENFELKVARNLREQQQALNSQMDLLRKTAEKRMNPAFDPALMAAAAGFAKPTKVTKELCEFMDKPEGSEIARTEVTKALVIYIKNNNLLEQGEDLKNKIVPDQKLQNLLGIKSDELLGLTYFNIQKYMNKHFYSNKTAVQLSNLVVQG